MNATQMSGNNANASSLSLQSAGPVLLFLAVNRLAGLRWAVVAATVVSIALIVDRRRKGLPLGRFMPILTAAVIARGAIGAITESEAIYFGLGIAAKYAGAAVLIGSAVVRRPLASKAAPYVMELPAGVDQHKAFRSAMTTITLVAGLYYCISATIDVWLFRRTSVEGFVALRFIANWPLAAVALVAIFATAQRQLSKIAGISSVAELVERKMAANHTIPGQFDERNSRR